MKTKNNIEIEIYANKKEELNSNSFT